MKQIYCLRLFMFLMVMFPLTSFAQGTVSGTITEASTGNPLPGANVVVKGTSNGTTTDFDGNFNHAIMIRSFLSKNHELHFQAGAGIVADSVPESEDAECQAKAMAVLNAVAVANSLVSN